MPGRIDYWANVGGSWKKPGRPPRPGALAKVTVTRPTSWGVKATITGLRSTTWAVGGTSVATTQTVYGNTTTHPKAILIRSGYWATAPGRQPIFVADEDPGWTTGTNEPMWANTAITSTAGLTTFVGNSTNHHELVSSADGQVIQNMYLPDSRIRIRHKNVVVKNCLIGIGWDSARLMIQNNCAVVCDYNFDTTGWVLDHVTCDPVGAGDPADPLYGTNPDSTAIVSAFYMIGRGGAYRCAARNVTDGFMPDNPSVGASTQAPSGPIYEYANFIQTRWLSYDPEQTDGTHNDGTQFANGDGHVLVGNVFLNPNTAGPGAVSPYTPSSVQGQCILTDPYHEPTITNTYIDRNWLYGGYSQFANWNPSDEGGPGVQGVTYTNNRHGGRCVYPILSTPAAYAMRRNFSGNVAAGVSVNNSNVGGGLVWGDGQNNTIATGGAIPVTQVARA